MSEDWLLIRLSIKTNAKVKCLIRFVNLTVKLTVFQSKDFNFEPLSIYLDLSSFNRINKPRLD